MAVALRSDQPAQEPDPLSLHTLLHQSVRRAALTLEDCALVVRFLCGGHLFPYVLALRSGFHGGTLVILRCHTCPPRVFGREIKDRSVRIPSAR